MTARLADALLPHLDGINAIVVLDGPQAGTFSHFIADLGRPVRAGTAVQSGEFGLVRIPDTLTGLDRLGGACAQAPTGAGLAVLLAGSTEALSSDAVAEAITAPGAEILAVTSTVYPSFPLLVLLRRTPQTADGVAETLVTRLESLREAPEGSGTGDAALLDLDPEVRARLDRMRAETARMRHQMRAAVARAESAEKALRRANASAAWKVGRLLVEAAKSPRKIFTLPRDLFALWRLRTARRRGTVTAEVETGGTFLERADVADSRLLRPRLGGADAPGRLSIVAVVDDRVAATLAPYATVTRVTPHDAGEVVATVDPDLVIIDSAAAQSPGPWLHLGDPAAADREAAALDLVLAAQDLGRPVVFRRSGDLSLSAGLHDLAARCDLVMTDRDGSDLPAWDPGVDLRACYASTGGARSGSVWIGDLSLRMPTAQRADILDLLRHAPGLTIHPRADVLTTYPLEWPADLRERVGESIVAHDLTHVLARSEICLAGDPTDPIASHAIAAGARVVTPVSQDALTLLTAGPLTVEEHRSALQDLFENSAAPVRLQSLCRMLRLTVRPLAVRDVALVVADAEPGIAPAILRQTHRPTQIAVADDSGLDELRAAGISVRRTAEWSPGALARLLDSPISFAATAAEVRRWPRDQVRTAVIAHESGMGVRA